MGRRGDRTRSTQGEPLAAPAGPGSGGRTRRRRCGCAHICYAGSSRGGKPRSGDFLSSGRTEPEWRVGTGVRREGCGAAGVGLAHCAGARHGAHAVVEARRYIHACGRVAQHERMVVPAQLPPARELSRAAPAAAIRGHRLLRRCVRQWRQNRPPRGLHRPIRIRYHSADERKRGQRDSGTRLDPGELLLAASSIHHQGRVRRGGPEAGRYHGAGHHALGARGRERRSGDSRRRRRYASGRRGRVCPRWSASRVTRRRGSFWVYVGADAHAAQLHLQRTISGARAGRFWGRAARHYSRQAAPLVDMGSRQAEPLHA